MGRENRRGEGWPEVGHKSSRGAPAHENGQLGVPPCSEAVVMTN